MTRDELLLDTHVALWAAAEPTRLTASARAAIEDAGTEVWISAISLAEIAIKTAVGKLRDVPGDLPARLLDRGFGLLPVSAEHAWKLNDLPLHHRDPFDRLLIAQALHERMPMVSADARFADYEQLDLIW